MQAPNGEGSPVDVAKLYMRARPPWASPSVDHNKPPTLSGIQLFKEETPHLFSGNSTSSSKVPYDVLLTFMSLTSLVNIYLDDWALHFEQTLLS